MAVNFLHSFGHETKLHNWICNKVSHKEAYFQTKYLVETQMIWIGNTSKNTGFIPQSHRMHNFNRFQWISEAVVILLK